MPLPIGPSFSRGLASAFSSTQRRAVLYIESREANLFCAQGPAAFILLSRVDADPQVFIKNTIFVKRASFMFPVTQDRIRFVVCWWKYLEWITITSLGEVATL